jgi:hypothetical protein
LTVPTVNPSFSAICLLESPRDARIATCRRRLVKRVTMTDLTSSDQTHQADVYDCFVDHGCDNQHTLASFQAHFTKSRKAASRRPPSNLFADCLFRRPPGPSASCASRADLSGPHNLVLLYGLDSEPPYYPDRPVAVRGKIVIGLRFVKCFCLFQTVPLDD